MARQPHYTYRFTLLNGYDHCVKADRHEVVAGYLTLYVGEQVVGEVTTEHLAAWSRQRTPEPLR